MSRLSHAFYERSSVEVAEDLLGKVLVKREPETELRGRIVETEAYSGEADPGSHAFRGPTKRTEVMFGPAGHLYVYFTYGMHYCMNVVTDEPGVAGAVLIRALEPLSGIAVMQERRNRLPVVQLCNGPAKLCQAYEISRTDNGADLTTDDIWIEDDGTVIPTVAVSTRVGLSAGRELPLRFYVPQNQFVSPGRPSLPLSD